MIRDNGHITDISDIIYFFAIKSFYKAFQIILPEIILNTGNIGLKKNIGRRLERSDIAENEWYYLSRERALIYVMAFSGMRQQEARDLTINKLLDSASSAVDVMVVTVFGEAMLYENILSIPS